MQRKQIEIIDVLNAMLRHLRLYIIIMPIALFILLIYALGIPNIYTTEVVLSLELEPGERGKLTFFATSELLRERESTKNKDAFGPFIYPELVKSYEFKKQLLSIKIKPSWINNEITYHDYLLNYQKLPWWSEYFSMPQRVAPKPINIFRPTSEEEGLLNKLDGRIKCRLDEKRMVITLQSVDQDPVVCVMLADSAKVLLEREIIAYHSKKAATNKENVKRILAQRKNAYEQASKKYSSFVDANRDVISKKEKTKISELESEMNLCYEAYIQTQSQVIAYGAKEQETKPVFATLKSATLPFEHVSPDRIMMVILDLCYVFYLITFYILCKEKDWRRNVNLKIRR